MYIDGFIINNYPIDIFKNELENTIGINLNERHYYKDLNVKNYIHNLFTILTKNKEQINKDLKKKLKKNIYLKCNISELDINIKKEKKINEINKCYMILKEEMKDL